MFFHGFQFTNPWGWGWSIVGLLVSIMIICVFVRIILRIVRGEHCHHHRHWDNFTGKEDPSAAARRILDERYAKGEIDDEEYKRKRENLK